MAPKQNCFPRARLRLKSMQAKPLSVVGTLAPGPCAALTPQPLKRCLLRARCSWTSAKWWVVVLIREFLCLYGVKSQADLSIHVLWCKLTVCFHCFLAREPENFTHKLTWEGEIGAKNKWWQEWQEFRNSVNALNFELWKLPSFSYSLFSPFLSLSLTHSHSLHQSLQKSKDKFFKNMFYKWHTHTHQSSFIQWAQEFFHLYVHARLKADIKNIYRKNLPYHIRPHIYLFLYLASGSDQFLTLHRKVGGKSNKRKIYFLQACFRYSFPVITVFYNLLFLWSFIFTPSLTPATSYPISDLK